MMKCNLLPRSQCLMPMLLLWLAPSLMMIRTSHAVDTTTQKSKTLPTAADLLVTGLGNVPNYEAFSQFDGNMYAGTIPSDNANRTGEMMFWLFEPHHQEIENSMIL